MRPNVGAGGEGGTPASGYLPTFEVREAEMHDAEILPHLYSEDEVERLFPKIEASKPRANVEDWEPSEERQGRIVGLPGKTSRVQGRCEERTSVAPSRRSSSGESVGDLGPSSISVPCEGMPPGSKR